MTRHLRPLPAGHPSRALVLFAAAAFAAILTAGDAGAETPLTTVRVAQGLSLPLYVTAPPGDTTRLFIVEQRAGDGRGRIKILKNGVVLARPFLTSPALSTGSEQGLLGLAFAPDYGSTGRFYINYTRAGDGATIIERRTVSATDPDTASGTVTTLFNIPQPFANHNGGWMGFGPDGYLYISMGDGGSGGDPGDRAQNLNDLLGKMLRVDVSGAAYTSPPTNPFAGAIPGRDEVWAYGLRNPWRASFDRVTGDFIIADVGQNVIEEINFQPASSAGGENYGWRCYEGFNFYSESATTPCGMCVAAGCPKIFPHYQYDHSLGRCSVTGGYVYRGCAIPDLRGEYFFADYCAATIYSGRMGPDTLSSFRARTAELAPGGGLAINSITSFGEDARGELYICDSGGEVFRIVPKVPVAEADMPVLRVPVAVGDTLGATTPGNALLPGVTLFGGGGNRLRGVGYLSAAVIRDCETAAGACRTSRLRLGSFDVDVEACVDAAANRLTRRFIFTNRAGTAQNLEYVDVITPRLKGDEDGAMTVTPAGGGLSAVLAMYDSFQPNRWIRYWGTGSSGVTYAADVDTASQLVGRIAQDVALAGGTSAGPAAVGLALGFAFGLVPPAGVESVTVFTTVTASPPSGVEPSPPVTRRLAVGPVPFRAELGVHATLARGGPVQVDVFDVQGRRVRALFRGAMPVGANTLRWDGRNDSGRDVPAGIYFIRYAAEGATLVRRAVRIR